MVREVAKELAISERQVYRDLRTAERHLAALLWARRREVESHRGENRQTEEILKETELLGEDIQELEVQSLLHGVLDAVAPLADERGVRLCLTAPVKPLVIRASRMIARQSLVSVLSYTIQDVELEGDVLISLTEKREAALLTVSYLGSSRPSSDWERSLSVPQHLVRLLGGEWEASTDLAGRRSVSFSLRVDSRAILLVIDDNEGLIELFRRYLTGETYRLLGARDAEEGLRLAEEHSPDVIVLDVMMPQHDGWEILQLLRNRQRTRAIPVLVCSVINDPELAFSLGAAGFLAKPVKREELLGALELCQR
jgi:CheY-like chemotaxis protein